MILHNFNLYNSNCHHQNNFIKMTKLRSITFLIITTVCILILNFTNAYPTTEIATELSPPANTIENSNSSVQVAITHVVKTIEFQVGILQDDGSNPGNDTDMTTEEYIETDIKLLNVDLLRELLARATVDEESGAKRPELPQVEEGSDAEPKLSG